MTFLFGQEEGTEKLVSRLFVKKSLPTSAHIASIFLSLPPIPTMMMVVMMIREGWMLMWCGGEAEQASGGSFLPCLDVLTVEIGKARDNGEVEGEGGERKPMRASLEPKKWRRINAC